MVHERVGRVERASLKSWTSARRLLPRERRLLLALQTRGERGIRSLLRAPPPAFLLLGRRRSLLRAKEMRIKRTRGSVPEQAGAQRGAEHEPSARDAVAA